jgi:hypothetical protein
MAVEDFPFVKHLSPNIDFVVYIDFEGDLIVTSMKDVLVWSKNKCDCQVCSDMSKLLTLLENNHSMIATKEEIKTSFLVIANSIDFLAIMPELNNHIEESMTRMKIAQRLNSIINKEQ